MAGKLKGLNFKKLALKHGEKIMLAVVGAVVLFSLAMGTKWMPYGGHPREITNAVDEAEHKLAGKTWPDEEQEKFEVPPDETALALVSSIKQQVDPTPYQFTEKFRFDLNETTTPITDPELFTVKSLLADADRMVIYVAPEQPLDLYADQTTEGEEGTEEAGEKEPDEEDGIPDAFKSPNTGVVPSTFGRGIPGSRNSDDDERGRTGRGGRGSRTRGLGGIDPSMLSGFDPSMLSGLDPSMLTGLGAGGGRGGGRGRGGAPNMAAMMGAAAGADMGMMDMMGMMGGDAGGFGMGGFGAMGSEGRGLRYVAVRGAFPLRDQLKAIMKASNLDSIQEAEQVFHVIDFELERKKMLKDADDPWSGEWEKADIEVAKEILREAGSFAPETHEGIVTDSGMTMPLPERAMGIYGKHATHPDLEDFELSEEEMELEMQIQQKLLEEHQKNRQEQPEEIVRKKGFSEFVQDSRSLMTSLRPGGGMGRGRGNMDFDDMMGEDMMGAMGDFGGMAAMAAGMGGFGGMGAFGGGRGIGNSFARVDDPDSIIKKLEEAETDKDKKKLLREHIQKQISAEGEMLLFRYLDFDVEPGETYRYRVRLVVTNPNYGRKASEAAGLDHVVKGQTRHTEWSNLTEAVYVREDVDYFVEKVETRNGDPMRVQANFTLFQWDPDVGSTVTDRDLEVELGEEIGGFGKPHVLDPAKNRFEIPEEGYEFQTGDLIVDASFIDSINPTKHPDLQLPRTSRRDPGVSNQVLVVEKDGALSVIDQKSRLAKLKDRHQFLTWEQRNYQDIKGIEAKQSQDPIGGVAGMEDLEGIYGDIFGAGGAAGGAVGLGMDDDDGPRGRRANPLRKGGGATGRRR